MLALPGITLLPVPASTVPRWLNLARQWSITKAKIFDLQLAATALENGVTTICTFNVADFRRFEGINVITP
ncbi:type II toxin-antitoxin system VapC family toxin [Tundrisphaera sp. TA3]|uniref:type II toxin-antitoxin system VapC family toxin n=1 Tax=Tundrisphaera sp. TA3 TaxID=3435775 RepID=UPI003EC03D2C